MGKHGVKVVYVRCDKCAKRIAYSEILNGEALQYFYPVYGTEQEYVVWVCKGCKN